MTALNAVGQNGLWRRILVAKRPMPFSRGVSIVFLCDVAISYILHVIDWQTWLTQEDVDEIVAAGLNSVRIPMGFWVIEDIVDKTHEPYAEGGLEELVALFIFLVAMPKTIVFVDSRPQYVQRCRVMSC